MKFPDPFVENNIVNVVVETPISSRNKYVWDDKTESFTLRKMLPEGLTFPCNFGFVPHTMAEDDAPLDVIVLHEEPIVTGIVAACRVIGIIEVAQTKKNNTVRNDRIVAIPLASQQYSNVADTLDLDEQLLQKINNFFSYYHKKEGSSQEVLAINNSDVALKAIRDSLQ